MPYIFIWGGYVYQNIGFAGVETRLTNGTIERAILTRKRVIASPMFPSEYVNATIELVLGQCKKRKADDEEDSSDERMHDDDNEDKMTAKDTWYRKTSKVLKIAPTKSKVFGYYQKPLPVCFI